MKKLLLIILVVGMVFGFFLRELLREKPVSAKVVTIRSRNLDFQAATTAKTVGELLEEQGFSSSVITAPPARLWREPGSSLDSVRRGGQNDNESVTHGITIDVRKPLNIELMDGEKEVRKITTLAATVGDLLDEQNIALSQTDQVSPDLSTYLADKMEIVIDRIVDLEVIEKAEIPYEIRLEYDPGTLYGREEVISQGEVGIKEQNFLVTYKNGVEIRRRLLKSTIIEKPVTEFRKFGTKVEVEESSEGRASWYAYKGCMCAAHPFYEIGRYIRITSLASGKSIIVRINDRGPELEKHPDRVIDLDAAAYSKLAPLGSGTIGVRVELLK